MMYGQMTAGSWIYIGSQGIVQGTYETFVEVGRQHYGGNLKGRWILTGGLGGMGGAQPLAATMAGASMLAVECEPTRIEKRLETRYLDTKADTLDEALAMIEESRKKQQPLSVGLLGNAAEIFPELVRRGVAPDIGDRPDQRARSAERLPAGRLDARPVGRAPRARSAGQSIKAAKASMAAQVRAMLDFHKAGVPTFDYGNNIRQMAQEDGRRQRLRLPRLRAGLHPPAVLPRHRAVPLGRALRRSRGHLPHRREGEGADPRQQAPAPLARHGARAHQVPGPAGAHLLGRAWATARSSASPSTRWWPRAS